MTESLHWLITQAGLPKSSGVAEFMALQAYVSNGLLGELAGSVTPLGVSLWWLGQAGFCMRQGDLRIAVDPYLSNSLAKKYASTKFPHKRMLPAPVAPEDLTMLDYVFCTHGHTDHMDGETLTGIANANNRCRFVVPAAEKAKALERGVPLERMISVKAGDEIHLSSNASVSVVPSAHEERRQDENGCDYFLGYIFKLSGKHIYHPGDCVPFDGLQQWLEPHQIELALMPVNGRDDVRRSNGVPGNFHLEEAVDICRCAGISGMLGHHYGMFDFNTIDPVMGEATLNALVPSGSAGLVKVGTRYLLE